MGVGRDLLEEVALAGASGPELDHVIVALHEGHHAQQHGVLLPLGEARRLDTGRAQQEGLPLLGGEVTAGSGQLVEHVTLGELNFAQGADAEGSPALLLGDAGVVFQGQLGVEAAGKHAFMFADQVIRDPHVGQAQAGQAGHIGVVLGIQTGLDQVDDLDLALLASASLEQLLLAGLDGARLQLPLDHL